MIRPLLVALALLVGGAGCGSAMIEREVLRDMQLGYDAGERIVEPADDGLALQRGSTARVRVFETTRYREGAGFLAPADVSPVAIRLARSSDPSIVRVLGVTDNQVELEAGRVGNAELRIDTPEGLEDFQVSVAEPARVLMWHESVRAGGDEPVFLVGGTARFDLDRRDNSDRTLGGAGAELPLRVDPPGAAVVTQRPDDPARVDVRFERAGEITFRPLGGPAVAVVAVPPEEVAGVSVVTMSGEGTLDFLTELERERTRLAIVSATRVDGVRVLGIDGARIVASTPATCRVADAERWYWEGVFEVEAMNVGDCNLEATLGPHSIALSVPVMAPEQRDYTAGTAEPSSAP